MAVVHFTPSRVAPVRAAGCLVAAIALGLAGCGGDDDAGDAPAGDAPAAAESTGAASTGEASTDENPAGGDSSSDDAANVEVATGSGTATVTIDGITMQFEQVEPGPEDDYYTFCTPVSGTLQAVFPRVDESGAVVPGELSVVLIEPGAIADQAGELPEFSVDNGERFWTNQDGDPFDIPASGPTASGTATLVESGAIDPQTGQLDTTPFDATLEISC